jgi:hypothetical protein
MAPAARSRATAGRILRRAIGVGWACRAGGETGDIEVVLVRQGHPGEREVLASREPPLHPIGIGKRPVPVLQPDPHLGTIVLRDPPERVPKPARSV